MSGVRDCNPRRTSQKCLRGAERSFEDSWSSLASYAFALQQLNKCASQLYKLCRVPELQDNDAQALVLHNNFHEQSREIAKEATTPRTAIDDRSDALNRFSADIGAIKTQFSKFEHLARSVEVTIEQRVAA